MDNEEVFKRCLSILSDRERKIFVLRFIEEKTLDEIANEFCVSRERIRQLIARSLEILFKTSDNLRATTFK